MPANAGSVTHQPSSLDGVLTASRWFVRSPLCRALGLLSAMTGAGLAFGIMAYGAFANGEDYTLQSWVLIPPVWLGLAALWWLTTRWPFIGAIPMGALAFYAGGYFSDVYGQFPAGLLLLLGALVLVASATDADDGLMDDIADEPVAGSEAGI